VLSKYISTSNISKEFMQRQQLADSVSGPVTNDSMQQHQLTPEVVSVSVYGPGKSHGQGTGVAALAKMLIVRCHLKKLSIQGIICALNSKVMVRGLYLLLTFTIFHFSP